MEDFNIGFSDDQIVKWDITFSVSMGFGITLANVWDFTFASFEFFL